LEIDDTKITQKYISKQFGFDISYPQKWTSVEVNPKEIHFLPQYTPKEFVGKPGVTDIHIMVGEPKQPFDKEELIENAKGPTHKPFGGYQVLSQISFNIKSGDEGVLFEYQFTIGNFSFNSIEGIIVKGNRIYSIEGNTLTGNYNQYVTIFKNIINSINLK
jgi:hypothetical protein